MHIWDVLSRRRDEEPWETVGSVNAPDLDLAMMLARETHFRHGEGTTYALRARGDDDVHPCPDPTGIGGVIDRSYRKSEGYAGVGAKLRRVHEAMRERGLVIDRPRPRGHRARAEASHG